MEQSCVCHLSRKIYLASTNISHRYGARRVLPAVTRLTVSRRRQSSGLFGLAQARLKAAKDVRVLDSHRWLVEWGLPRSERKGAGTLLEIALCPINGVMGVAFSRSEIGWPFVEHLVHLICEEEFCSHAYTLWKGGTNKVSYSTPL